MARRDAHPRAGRTQRRTAAVRAPGHPQTGRAAAALARGTVAAVLMARKTSFYYSFLVLPAEQRRAIIAVWDFCRAVDDAVDEEPTVAAGLPDEGAGVDFWRAETARVFAGQPPSTEQGRRLQPFVVAF